ncbi:TPA: hypothetical protein DEP90_02815 [Patescibacteria group bacterium]|nr:hypothetical protein [Patescibacteria group bacterium]
MSFLPKGYKVPSGASRYLKLETGKNTVRILSDPIIGWEYWEEKDGKKTPIRVRNSKDIPSERNYSTDPSEKPKHFWAMFVWSRELEAIQLLEITQATIQTGIKSLVDDDDWGDPRKYDISINREGEGLDTKYTVNPKPKKELNAEIKINWKESRESFDLNKMYSGENPFGDDEGTPFND